MGPAPLPWQWCCSQRIMGLKVSWGNNNPCEDFSSSNIDEWLHTIDNVVYIYIYTYIIYIYVYTFEDHILGFSVYQQLTFRWGHWKQTFLWCQVYCYFIGSYKNFASWLLLVFSSGSRIDLKKISARRVVQLRVRVMNTKRLLTKKAFSRMLGHDWLMLNREPIKTKYSAESFLLKT